MSFSTITVCGNVGSAPQLKNVGQNNTAVLEMSVAVNHRENNQETVQWYRISVWGKRAETLNNLVRPGTMLAATGQLKVKLYTDKNNQPAISCDVTADSVELLHNFGNQQGQQQPGQQQYQGQYAQPVQQQAPAYQSQFAQSAQQPVQQQYAQPVQGYAPMPVQPQPMPVHQPAQQTGQQQFAQPVQQQAPAYQSPYAQPQQMAPQPMQQAAPQAPYGNVNPIQPLEKVPF